MKMYRQGAVGALLDIYEQAIAELIKVIEDIPGDAIMPGYKIKTALKK